MTRNSCLLLRPVVRLLCVLMVMAAMGGCQSAPVDRIQGYVEGEFVYVASPLPGKLLKRSVQRGDQVKQGDLLFELDNTAEKALRDEAEKRVAQARANLDDIQKGKRPSEIASIEAQLAQARAAFAFSDAEHVRMQKLVKSKATTEQEYEFSLSKRDQDKQRVAQLEADLATATLGARADQVVAARDQVRALEAALVKADWDLSQKQQSAHQGAVVFDTLFQEGEWVPAGRPVVALLPPGNIKVRAFLPEREVGAVHLGDAVRVFVDGVPEPFQGRVQFVSPRAEYTPPVIYSQETRDKLVFLIEISFDPAIGAKLHPGQPVDVKWK